jgi:Terminase small subunit
MSRQLSLKQRKFIHAYLFQTAGNATAAARVAGYRGNSITLASVGHQNLRKRQIVASLAEKLEDVANELVGAIPAKTSEASLLDLAKALSIVIDKKQLLATSPAEMHARQVRSYLTYEQRRERLRVIFEGAVAKQIEGQAAEGETVTPTIDITPETSAAPAAAAGGVMSAPADSDGPIGPLAAPEAREGPIVAEGNDPPLYEDGLTAAIRLLARGRR